MTVLPHVLVFSYLLLSILTFGLLDVDSDPSRHCLEDQKILETLQHISP
jgi:hypothetical protein